jgi:hypothetical protein
MPEMEHTMNESVQSETKSENAATTTNDETVPADTEASRNESGQGGDSAKPIGSRVNDSSSQGILVGGSSKKRAYALLDGFLQDPKDDSPPERLSVPVTRLPATLGRTHATSEPNFLGLGKAKAISRQQCRIDYRVVSGTLGQLQAKPNEFTYQPNKLVKDDFVNPNDEELDEQGFYTITCLGKNRIFVNGYKVEQGETALLNSGSALRIANYCLYFFLPVTRSTATMQIGKKRKRSSDDSSKSSSPKRTKPIAVNASTASSTSVQKSSSTTLQAELDSLSTQDLLDQLTHAIDSGVWERRHQLIGSTLAFRAVMVAAEDPELQDAPTGVSRGQVMDWIADSDTFRKWVEQMATKLEPKSYQSSITKAMVKAEYERTSSTGRYIKWLLPKQFRKSPDRKEEGKKEKKRKPSAQLKDTIGTKQDAGSKKQELAKAEDESDGQSSDGADENGDNGEEREDIDDPEEEGADADEQSQT